MVTTKEREQGSFSCDARRSARGALLLVWAWIAWPLSASAHGTEGGAEADAAEAAAPPSASPPPAPAAEPTVPAGAAASDSSAAREAERRRAERDVAGPELPAGPGGEIRDPGSADPRPIETPDIVRVAERATQEGDPHFFLLGFDRGFGVDTADRRFGVTLGAQWIHRITYGLDMNRDYQFSFSNFGVRPYLRAHAYGQRIRFYFLPEFSPTTARLLTVELTFQPTAAFAFRIGQFLTPFSRAFFTSSANLQLIDYGLANDVFRVGRDVGMMVFGTPFEGHFEYYLGLFNGNGMNKPELEPVNLMGVARVGFAPLGFVPYDQTQFLSGPLPFRIAFGIDGYVTRASPLRYATDPDTGGTIVISDPDRLDLAASADVHVLHGGFQVLAEAYVRHRAIDGAPNELGVGGSVQAGYYVRPLRLDFSGRANWVDLDVQRGGTFGSTYEAEVDAYLHGNNLKLELDYLYGDASVAMGRLAAGRQHRVTLQLHLFF